MDTFADRTHACRAAEIERLRQMKGFSLERLAAKAGIHVKTLRRMLRGERSFIRNIAAVAGALGTSPDALFDTVAPDGLESSATPSNGRFRLQLRFAGAVNSASQLTALADLPRQIVQSLASQGICAGTHAASLNFANDRDITICYLLSCDDTGRRAWYVLAVGSDKYEAFRAALDTDGSSVNLGMFGEIIASCYGEAIPRSVDALVRRLYPESAPDPASIVCVLDSACLDQPRTHATPSEIRSLTIS